MVDIDEARERLERCAQGGGPVYPADIRALLDALDAAQSHSAKREPNESREPADTELADAVAVIDRVDAALRGDGRSAMLIVVAQGIINVWRGSHDRR